MWLSEAYMEPDRHSTGEMARFLIASQSNQTWAIYDDAILAVHPFTTTGQRFFSSYAVITLAAYPASFVYDIYILITWKTAFKLLPHCDKSYVYLNSIL